MRARTTLQSTSWLALGPAMTIAFACALGGSAHAADAPPELRLAQAVQTYNLTLPLIFQGAYLGDVPVAAGTDGKIAVNVDRFIGLLGERVSPEMAVRLKEIAS